MPVVRKEHKILFITFILAITLAASAIAWAASKSQIAENRLADSGETQTAVAPTENADRWSQAVFKVRNMSCGGCISTIQKAVGTIDGTGRVDVDLATATATVMVDQRIVTDLGMIAKAISISGYPAQLNTVISSQDLKSLRRRQAKKSLTAIARVGQREVLRTDFNLELGHARSRYEQIYGPDTFNSPRGRQLDERLQAQIAKRLVDDAIKFQVLDRAGFTVKNETITKALNAYLDERKLTRAQLRRDLEANDYSFDYFQRKFAQRVVLLKYLEQTIYAESVDAESQQQRYADWMANARALADVVYYDKRIEQLATRAAGSCGGSGGSCSGGGCSASR